MTHVSEPILIHTRTRQAFRTPRAPPIAGIVFALLFAVAIVLLRVAVRGETASDWATDASRRGVVLLALNLLPFAGIAFLWFIGVIRDRLGEREDRFFSTVFLGSGLLFVGMLFAGGALAGGLIVSSTGTNPTDPDLWRYGRQVSVNVLIVYSMRMAGVFMMSTSTLVRQTEFVPQWLSYVGFVGAAILLVGAGTFYWAILIFPTWVLALSVALLFAVRRYRAAHR
jgi:hypothetical protein